MKQALHPEPEWMAAWGLADHLEWRMDTLLQAGYLFYDALELTVAQHVDLHRACDLLAAGCDPRLAARILL